MPIDAGAAYAHYRVDPSKPLDGNAIPGVDVDVVIDTEEERGRIGAPGRGVQPQSRLGIGHAAVVPAGAIRRVGPTRFAVLEVAHDLKTRRPQRARVLPRDGLRLEVRARPRLGHVIHHPAVAGRFNLV